MSVIYSVRFFRCSFLGNHKKIAINGNPANAGPENLGFSVAKPQCHRHLYPKCSVGPMIIGFRVWYRNRPSPESCPDSPPWGLARSCPDPVSHSRILAESCPDSDSNLKNCRKNRKNPPKIYYKYALSSSMSMTFAFALPPRWMVFRMVTILTNSLCSECNCLYVQ
jgi:hypothetical protein